MNNKNLKAILSVFVIVSLIITSTLVYFVFFYEKNEPKVKELPEKEIDDRISPLTNQAVFLKIHRIRKKGIIDMMMNSGPKLANLFPKDSFIHSFIDGLIPGRGWRKIPTFNYIATLDGFEHKGPKGFNTWDADYINQEFFRNVEEEQDNVKVSIIFIEIDKKLIRTLEHEIESFDVLYDFRTGRWTGDDHFNDSDGYGHYDGSTYEMWFSIHQTDRDGDGIPYWTEVNVLGTDPIIDNSKTDHDNDGIPTSWEWKWGYDPFTWDNHTYLDPDNDGLQNSEEYFMEKWLANPYQPEIYIEVDNMEKAPFRPIKFTIEKGRFLPIPRPRFVRTKLDGVDHIFYEQSQQMIMDRFNENGINVHIDDGVMGGGGEFLPFYPEKIDQEGGIASEYYHNNFADERKGIFRYLFINHWGGWCHPQDFKHWYDTLAVPSSREFFLSYLGGALTQRTRIIGRAVQVLHELGHSCGLRPEEWAGIDNMTYGGTTWIDYESCLNYHYFGLRKFDYSHGINGGDYDRNDWETLDVSYFQKTAEDMEGLGS